MHTAAEAKSAFFCCAGNHLSKRRCHVCASGFRHQQGSVVPFCRQAASRRFVLADSFRRSGNSKSSEQFVDCLGKLFFSVSGLKKSGMEQNSSPRVFLDIKADGRPLGRVVLELDMKRAPKTAANFLALCTGSHKHVGKPVPQFLDPPRGYTMVIT